MRVWALAIVLTLALASGAAGQDRASVADCGGYGQLQSRTTLYFGLSRPDGGPMVSELEWQVFLRDEVTPRFPHGLTVLDARGQWLGAAGRIDSEPSKVLVLIHPGGAEERDRIGQIVSSYRRSFQQEAVLWETARVCVAFE